MFPNLGETAEWKLIVFTDAAHANLCDGISSMGAHLVLLTGVNRRCCPLSWQANKIKRVVRSTIAAETLGLQEGLEDGIYLRKFLEELSGSSIHEIPISAFVDNKNVVEAIHSTKMVDDKRLRIDISTIKESV